MAQDLEERARSSTVVQGGTGGKTLEAQLHLAEGALETSAEFVAMHQEKSEHLDGLCTRMTD